MTRLIGGLRKVRVSLPGVSVSAARTSQRARTSSASAARSRDVAGSRVVRLVKGGDLRGGSLTGRAARR